MRKFATAVLAVCVCLCMCAGALALTGCKSSGAAGGHSKSVVVYFSAQDHTKRAAKLVAEMTGSELFAIEPTLVYTDDDLDTTNPASRVCLERTDESRRCALTSTDVPNWDEITTVYLGYPIWWEQAAWPVDQFVSAVDFDGKTVIPFCTSASNDAGESATALEKTAGAGTWEAPTSFPETFTDTEVQNWALSVTK